MPRLDQLFMVWHFTAQIKEQYRGRARKLAIFQVLLFTSYTREHNP